MTVQAAFVGEPIAAYRTRKRLWPDCMVQHMFGSVGETAEHFAAILARVRAVLGVVVHMFPQIRFTSECFITHIADELLALGRLRR